MRYYLLSINIFLYLFLSGQESAVQTQKEVYNFAFAQDLFEEDLYGPSKITFDDFLKHHAQPLFSPTKRQNTIAEIDEAIANLRLGSPDGALKLKNVIQYHYNKPEILPAILEYGSYCYNNSNYEEAISIYSLIQDPANLPESDMSEVSFKKGYSYFVTKDFKSAIQEFSVAKELRNTYFHANNYYYGMCQYFENNFTGAVESFKRAANADLYKNQIPYYLCQIYFAQKDYDKLISYGEQKINDPNTESINQIRLLLGQAYYNRNDFDRAIPHLEYYEEHTEQLTAEEFYQLAFTQYKLQKWDKAKSNFIELTNLETKMGQLSNYYLADCLIKLKDKNSARSAFKKVAGMAFDTNMKEEATFNYGKISAELGSEREAINVLVDIDDKSRFYGESQEIINDILVNSGDFVNSIKIIESLPKVTEKIKKTYQSIALKQATQFYAEGNDKEASIFFEKSLLYPIDRTYTAQTYYWMGQMKNIEGKYNESIQLLDKYFEFSNGINDIPSDAAAYMGHYVQGYNFLKNKDYKKAELQFKNSIVGININREEIKNDYVLNRVLPDAFIRTGDCLFKIRDFTGAKTFYDQAISRQQGGYVYALYQRGLIEGLSGSAETKIATMSEIINNHSNSEYADDAHIQVGDTYLALGNIEKSAVYFIEALSKYGQKSAFYNEAQLKLGLINFNRGDIPNAMYYYKKVINSNPSPQERAQALASIQEIYIDNLASADNYIKYLDTIGYKVSGLGKDSLTFHLAYAIFNNADYPKAVEAFNEYLNNFPLGYYKNDARYFRAESYNVQKNYNKSLQDYEAIIKDGPSKFYNKAIYKAAIIAFNYTQDFDKALKYYKEYEVIADDIGEKFQCQYGCLRSAFKNGKDADVITYGQKVLDNAASTKDEKAVAHYYMAKTYTKQNNLQQAQKSFQLVEQLGANNQAAEARYMLAEFYFKEKLFDKAEKQANYANEKNANYPFWIAKSLLLLSDIYIGKNDLLNARAAIEAVLDNFKDDPTLISQANIKLEALKILETNANRVKPTTNKLDLLPKKSKQ
jgi:tetratricopeptide (TPR) repeat protein